MSMTYAIQINLYYKVCLDGRLNIKYYIIHLFIRKLIHLLYFVFYYYYVHMMFVIIIF